MTSTTIKPPESPGFVRRYWSLIVVSFIGWSLLAAIPTTSAYLGSGAPEFAVWWMMFTKIGLYYYLWGLLAPLLYRLTDTLPYRGAGLLVTIPTHLAVLTVLSVGFGLIVHQSSWQEWLLGNRALGYHSMSAFTYALIVLCCLAIKFYRLSLLRQREASDAKVHAAQLDNKLNLARVDSLRMQMNPHFLFNALNSVGALIESEQRDRAYDAVEQLGDLLRHALNLSKVDDVSVDQELTFCEAYLSMEQIRFGDRLHVEWSIDDAARELQVPAFVLQPSVENAIKHAVSPSSGPVTVSISARIVDDRLQLRVEDNGQFNATSNPASGIGIANLRERLRLRYGSDVAVESGANAIGFVTTVTFPLPLIQPAHST